MNKQEFLLALRGALHSAVRNLPEEDLQASLDYYAEIIDDRMEEGDTEAEAVASLGSVVAVAEGILLDMPLPKLVKARIKPKRRLRTWEIVLIAAGFPLWFPLLLALGAILLAVYVSLWAVVISLYAADLSLAVGFLGGIAGSALLFPLGNPIAALALLSAGLVCGGLAIFLFFGCKACTKGTIRLAAKMLSGIKKCFMKKETA